MDPRILSGMMMEVLLCGASGNAAGRSGLSKSKPPLVKRGPLKVVDNVSYVNNTIPVRCLYVTGLEYKKNLKQTLINFFEDQVGPVDEVRVSGAKNPKNSRTTAFVTLKDYEDAHRALIQKNYQLRVTPKRSLTLYIRAADSWHQPVPSEVPSSHVYDPTKPSLDDLNDDCLLHIFDMLEIHELVELRGISERWDDVLMVLAKTRYSTFFDFDLISDGIDVSTTLAHQILNFVGPVAKDLSIDFDSYSKLNKIKVLEAIRDNCVALENLEIDGFKIFPKSQSILADIFKRLKSFESGAGSEFNRAIGECFKVADNLRSLTINMNEEFDGSCLTDLKNLEILDLNNCHSINSMFLVPALKQLSTTLRSLNIQRCDLINDTVVDVIAKEMLALEELSISNHYTGMKKFGDLGKCINLKKLTIEFRSFNEVDDLLETLTQTNQLEELVYIGAGSQRKDTMKHVSKLTNLKVLNMAFNAILIDEDIEGLTTLTKLEKLTLFGVRMVTATPILNVIKSCPQLKFLDVSETGMDDEFVSKVLEIQKNSHERPKITLVVYNTKIQEEEAIRNPELLANKHNLELDFTKYPLESQFYMGEDDDYNFSDEDYDIDDYDIDEDDDDYDFPWEFDVNEQWGFFDSDDDKYMYGWGNINSPDSDLDYGF